MNIAIVLHWLPLRSLTAHKHACGTHTHTHTHTCIYTHTHMYTHIHSHVHNTYSHVHTHTHIYTTRTHSHVHTHTCTHQVADALATAGEHRKALDQAEKIEQEFVTLMTGQGKEKPALHEDRQMVAIKSWSIVIKMTIVAMVSYDAYLN